MSKYYGYVGFAETKETSPGVWKEAITERDYYGDITRDTRKLQDSSQRNDNVNISNQISIVADPFAYNNFHSIRYVTFMGSKWKVSDVEVQFPRLILSVGEVYNGE